MDWNEIVAHAPSRVAPSLKTKKRARPSHECERGRQECVRHSYSYGDGNP
jgi:hypothetical protein